MSHIFDFFLEPYKQASWVDILLEITAVVFGIASVVYAKMEKILVFPTGIISTIIYIYICFHFVLYGDMIINIYYSLMSIYGWYMWSRPSNGGQLQISRTTTVEKIKAAGIFLFTGVFVIFIYIKYQVIDGSLNFMDTIDLILSNMGTIAEIRTITPYLDTITTGVFFSGMWLMANKKIENWILWIIGNLVSVPLYFVKGLGFTAIQFTVFLVLAIFGYITWKKHLDKNLVIA